jgi:hypothetical protein
MRGVTTALVEFQYVFVPKQHSSYVVFVTAVALSPKLHKRLQQQAVNKQ